MSCFATIGFEDAVFPELAVSGRALAMGNAFISKVDDSSAVYYNPAGLGTIRSGHIHLSNFHMEANKGWMNAGTGGSLTTAAGNFMKGFDLNGTRELLLENRGTISHSRIQFMPNFTARNFSMGYLISMKTRATIDSAADAKYEYSTRRDHGPYVSVNIPIFGGVIKVGGTATYLNRREAQADVDKDTSIALESNDYNKGAALIITGGAKLTIPFMFLPTFSATMHNAAGQKFSSARGAGAPGSIKTSMDLGFSLTPQIGKILRVHMEVNLKDFGNQYPGVGSSRKIAAGMELDIARAFFFRLGYGDGFGSAGLGVKSKRLEFDLTTYAVDATTSAYRGKEDRRFAMTLSSGF